MTVAQPTARVMHVITGLDTGGAETQLALLVGARKEAGAEDIVVSLIPGGAVRQRLENSGVTVHDLGMRRGRPSLTGLLRLRSLIRRTKPRIVQSWMYHADLISAFALQVSGRKNATRLIWGIRCSDMNLADYGRGLRWTLGLCVRYSHVPDMVVANSEAGLKAHVDLGYQPRHSRVIDNGIDTARFRPDAASRAEVRAELAIDSGVKLVAHVARVDPMKDHETLLTAMRELPDVELLLIGLGTESLAARPGWHGLGRRADVPRLLSTCDLIVASSEKVSPMRWLKAWLRASPPSLLMLVMRHESSAEQGRSCRRAIPRHWLKLFMNWRLSGRTFTPSGVLRRATRSKTAFLWRQTSRLSSRSMRRWCKQERV